jgi:glycosyltransferase involved in cell wall biosynthesis
LRVLICIESLGIGGKERQAVELIKGLARRPLIDCAVICLERDDFYVHDARSAGLSVEFLPRRWRWDPAIFRKLFRFVKRFQPDVIHTNGLMSSFYSLSVARLVRIPLINRSIRNAFVSGGFRWTLEKLLLQASGYRVANSYAGLRSRSLSEKGCRNRVIYNGFDFDRLERLASHPNVGGTAGEKAAVSTVKSAGAVKSVGMVAEFSRFKDYPTFIQMARNVSARRKDVAFVLVGDGPILDECQKAAEGITALRFLGKQKSVERIIATFDIGVLCTFVEGLSNSIMEYMALARPVVVTDGGGTRELVTDGVTGFLVPPADTEMLAAKIEYLLDHPTVANRMGEAGEARLRGEFSITRMVDETIDMYNLALAGSAGGRAS